MTGQQRACVKEEKSGWKEVARPSKGRGLRPIPLNIFIANLNTNM